MERFLKVNDKIELKGIDGSYIIKDIIGRGSSCVVYSTEFYNENGEKTEHLLKEFNPKCIDLKRQNGELKPIKNEDAELFELLLKRFKDGFDRQAELRSVPELKNYTANIQNTYYDHGTIYIDMTETEGRSYAEVKETSLYNLAQRIRVLTQVIGNYHKRGYLHLDIKPSNIFVRPEKETCEDVLLFDCDSLVPLNEVNNGINLSYTLEWAPIELTIRSKGYIISKATDIFSIGEIFFEKLMGRHSKPWERRSTSKYAYDLNAPIFENTNPKVLLLLDELFRHTLCNNPNDRYQTADELIEILDRIVEIYNLDEPFYLKKLFTDYSNFNPHFDKKEIQSVISLVHCETEWEYMNSMDEKIQNAIIDAFQPQSKIVEIFSNEYSTIFESLREKLLSNLNDEKIKSNISERIINVRDDFLEVLHRLLDFKEIRKLIVDVQDSSPRKVEHLNLCKPRKYNSMGSIWDKLRSEIEDIIDPRLETLYSIPLQCELKLLDQIETVLAPNEYIVRKEYLKTIDVLFDNVKQLLKNSHKREQDLYQKAIYHLYSGDDASYNEGLRLLFLAYEENPSQHIAEEINKQIPLFKGTPIEYIDFKIFFTKEEIIYDTIHQYFCIKHIDGTEKVICDFLGSLPYKLVKFAHKLYVLRDLLGDDGIELLAYDPKTDQIDMIETKETSVVFGELVLKVEDKNTLIYGIKSKWKQLGGSEDKIFTITI